MAKKSKDFLISTADVAFFVDGVLAFTGNTSLNTSISVSMEDTEITGGKGNKTLYKYKYGRTLSASIEMAEWRLEYIAAQVNSPVAVGLRDCYAIAECVTLTDGVGVLAYTPVDGSNVFVEDAEGNIYTVTAEGNTITIDGLTGTENVNATYQHSKSVKNITIDADSTPMVGTLVLSADKHNNLKGKVGEVQIEIPSFQLSGTFDISLEASGNTTTTLDGDALAVDGDSCSDGAVYGYILEIPIDDTETTVSDIVARPSEVTLAVGETQTLSIIGMQTSSNASVSTNIGIEASECTFVSSDTSIATVDESGVITAVAAGTAYIDITYGEDDSAVTDSVKVTVTE